MSTHLGPSFGEFAPVVGTMAEYEIASDLTGIYDEPPAGLVIHYAGPIGDKVLSGSVWAARQCALDFFSDRAGEGLTELVRQLTAPERDPDLTYQLLPAEPFVIGPAAGDFESRGRGEADGAVLVRTPGVGELPSADDSELILAACKLDDDLATLYEFRVSAPRQVDEGGEVIHLHSIFTSGQGVSQINADAGHSA